MDILSKEVLIVVIASAFFMLVAVGVIVLILVYQKKQLRFILEKAELKSQFQQELLKTRLEAREETLNWLAKELHDNISQLLNSSKVLISVAQRTNNSSETLSTAGDTISQAITELRMLSKSLSHEWLERFNFLENLKAEANRINASHEIAMTVEHPDNLELSREKQLMLFRIVQEAFQNSLKHGHASQIKIAINKADSGLTIMVEDNGTGFNTNEKQGFGMHSIQHRASLLGGSALWVSGDTGTKVKIQLPLSA